MWGLLHVSSSVLSIDTVHPHVCGAYFSRAALSASFSGSSPRMWGLLIYFRLFVFVVRFIPTYVGLTPLKRSCTVFCSVHPHVCGAYTCQPCQSSGRPAVHPHVCGAYQRYFSVRISAGGSSPRMWSLHVWLKVSPVFSRFIPTYVGLTKEGKFLFILSAVHPHVCGAYKTYSPISILFTGSSPRMWGLLSLSVFRHKIHRFIPTYVGLTDFIYLHCD